MSVNQKLVTVAEPPVADAVSLRYVHNLTLEEVDDQFNDLGRQLTQRQVDIDQADAEKQAAAARDDADDVATAIARKRKLQAGLPELDLNMRELQARAEELRGPLRRAKDAEIQLATIRRRSDQQAVLDRYRAIATAFRAIPTDLKTLRGGWADETRRLLAERVALDPYAKVPPPALDEPAMPEDELIQISRDMRQTLDSIVAPDRRAGW